MKKIIVYGMSSNLGGTEVYIMNLYRNINKAKIQMDFINRADDRVVFQDEIESLGSVVYNLPNFKAWYNFSKKYASEYDVAIFNTVNPFDLYYLELLHKSGIKRIIIHSHIADFVDFRFPKILFHIEWWRFKRLNCEYWACSEKAGKWMFGNLPFTIIKNGINLEKFRFNEQVRYEMRKSFGFENDIPIIGHIGRFDHQKNQPFIIELFKIFLEKHPEARLVLVGASQPGSGYLEKVEKLAKDKGIYDKIAFLGLRNDTDRLYQIMDVFVLPSEYEGLPICGIEAQCSGLPCIFSNTITKEAAFTDNVCFNPIEGEDCLDKWVSSIDNYLKLSINRIDTYVKLKKAGYDIIDEARNVEKLLLD